MKGKKIIPPGSVIIFNQEISLDDGKLAQSIASAGDTDIEEAKQKVLELVDKIVFSLNKGETFIFEGIGSLYKDENNVIRFENDPGLMMDFDSYGLESFELESVEEEIPKETTKSESDNETEAPASKEYSVPYFQERNKTISHPEVPEKRTRSGLLLYVFSFLVFLIAVLFILWCRTDILDEVYYNTFCKPRKDSVNLLTGDKNIPSEDLKIKPDSSAGRDNTADRAEKETVPLNKVTSKASGYKEYHIIAGSFKDTTNALLLARELTMQGYPVIIIEQKNNLYRVSAMSFRDKESGLKELTSFRGKTKNNAAWLLELGN